MKSKRADIEALERDALRDLMIGCAGCAAGGDSVGGVRHLAMIVRDVTIRRRWQAFVYYYRHHRTLLGRVQAAKVAFRFSRF